MPSKYDQYKDKVTELIGQGVPQNEVADRLGITRGSIGYLLDRWGLKGKASQSRGGYFTKEGKERLLQGLVASHTRGRTHPFKGMVRLRGEWVTPEEQLQAIKDCIALDMTYEAMMEELQLSSASIWKPMKQHGLLQGFREKDRSPFWKGGHSKYRGPGWQQRRKECLQRDGYKCARCGQTNAQEIKDRGRELAAHHIVPYEQSQDSSLGNLMTLCQPCHMIIEPR